ncbi:MAG: hypothetical protein ACR2IH_12825 [Pyrinomonadaceae bacterium]
MNKKLFLLGVCLLSTAVFPQTKRGGDGRSWTFAVSGDSRNCGDIVMPAIAADLDRTGAGFYWHLGDLRAVYDFDEDIKMRPGIKPPTIYEYESFVWQDMIESQINRFKIPFFLGIGNHETAPPKTRNDFLIQFADWLTMPVLQNQRLQDDPNDHKLRAYFHWQERGVDFIYLDNSTTDQFDLSQQVWLNRVLDRDATDSSVKTIVVGMHEALPDSLSYVHSMSDYANGVQSGRLVYQRLLKARNVDKKQVYVLASHSHFLMDNIFASDYWKANGGVLPGWIVGTAGAYRYALPSNAQKNSPIAKTNVYGYLLGTVDPAGAIDFQFQEVKEANVPTDVRTKFGPELMRYCFDKNSAVTALP